MGAAVSQEVDRDAGKPQRRRVGRPAKASLPVSGSAGAGGSTLISTPDCELVNTLARGLQVLQAFDTASIELGNKDVAGITGIPKATISRLTSTLVKLHFLEQNSSTGLYRLGKAALSLGIGEQTEDEIAAIVMPYLEEFANYHGVDVTLGTLDGLEGRARIVSGTPSDRYYPMSLAVDAALDSTALGFGLLAGLGEGRRAEVLDSLRSERGEAWDAAKARVGKALGEIEQQGYAVSLGEWSGQINAIGAPLRGSSGTDQLSVCCGGFVDLVPFERLDQLGPYFVGLMGTIETVVRRHIRN